LEGHPPHLQAEKVDVNAPDLDGRPPLLTAAIHGHTEAIRELTLAGARPNAVDPYGRTPLLEVWHDEPTKLDSKRNPLSQIAL